MLSAWALAGCNLAPAYKPPVYAIPDSYQGAGPWEIAHPQDGIAQQSWWTSYGNVTLDELELRLPQNPDLMVEEEAFVQARELAAEAASGLYPQLGVQGQATYNRQSPERLFRSFTSTAPLVEPSVQVDATASWEIDIWQRIANEARSRKRLAQAQAANLAFVKLSLQAELANAYFTLRGLDQQTLLFEKTAAFFKTGLDVTQARLADKIGNELDVVRAQGQYNGALALLYESAGQRALALHAIADLIGVPANGFLLPPQQMTPVTLPNIPTGLPSQLLQRRPDVAAAERNMASANADIGVARAAFYPNVSLSAVAGTQDRGFNVISLPNAMWSVGSAIALPLFEGGLRRAELGFAKSAYRQTRDQYRSVVLSAFQQVEDQLVLNDFLVKEAEQDKLVFAATSRAQNLALQLYTGGVGNYLDVVVAQVTAFQAATSQLSVDIRVQQASINLVRALGGGWSAEELPTEKQVMPFNPLAPP